MPDQSASADTPTAADLTAAAEHERRLYERNGAFGGDLALAARLETLAAHIPEVVRDLRDASCWLDSVVTDRNQEMVDALQDRLEAHAAALTPTEEPAQP